MNTTLKSLPAYIPTLPLGWRWEPTESSDEPQGSLLGPRGMEISIYVDYELSWCECILPFECDDPTHVDAEELFRTLRGLSDSPEVAL